MWRDAFAATFVQNENVFVGGSTNTHSSEIKFNFHHTGHHGGHHRGHYQPYSRAGHSNYNAGQMAQGPGRIGGHNYGRGHDVRSGGPPNVYRANPYPGASPGSSFPPPDRDRRVGGAGGHYGGGGRYGGGGKGGHVPVGVPPRIGQTAAVPMVLF